MSQENVETVRRLIEAFNADDLDRLLAEFHPEAELHSRFTAVGGVYRGHAGLRRWHRDLADTWEYLGIEPERLIEVDDRTVAVLLILHGKGRGSGVEIRQELAHVDTLRAGKVTRVVTYTDPAEALDAVGLSE